MDLLLTHGYILEEDPKERSIMKPYAPLGLLYLSAYLRQRGYGVEIYDSTFGSRRGLYDILQSGPPAVLGLYGTLMTRANVLEIVRSAREAGWKVVLGGPEPASYAEEYLDSGADVIVQGEGEAALDELLRALRAGAELSCIDGIVFRNARGDTVRTPPRPLLPDLDALPWPDRDRIDIGEYIRVWREHHGMGSASVITARGCPYHCRWCSHAVFGKTFRHRSPSGVADEIESILERYQPDMLWFADDVFTLSHPWIFRYEEEMRKRDLRIPFECITRADRVNARIADSLAQLGCMRVWIGSESGSQRILDAMERGVRVGEVRDAIRLFRERGVQTGMFLMWGYAGEDLSDIEATVEHVKESLPDVFLTTVAYPIRGTPFYEEVARRLAPPADWSSITDRDLRIRGRHSRRFFQHADQLLRSEVALKKITVGSAGPEEKAALEDLRGQITAARAGLRATFEEVEA